MTRTARMKITDIAQLSRKELMNCLLSFDGDFRFDFTPEYLGGLSVEELRHLLLAACLHARKRTGH